MSVSNGQNADAATFNAAFMDKNQDTGTTGVVDLNNTTDVNSGPEITNTQRYINEQADASGVNGIGDATRKTYSSTNVVSNGDNRKVAVGKLDAEFDPSTGHGHTGGAGDGPKIDYVAGLTGTQLKGYLVQGTQLTAVVGSSKDVSTQLTGEANSTGQTVEGVVSTAPNNIVQLLDVNDNNFEDAFGNKVYGRLTFSASVWTLSFYSLIAGVETAYTFASSTINWYYQKLFTESNRPVYSDQSILVSNQLSGEIPDASASLSGKVNISSQTFAGKKTLQDGIVIDASLEIPRTDSASPGASTLTYHPFIRITGAGGDTIQGITAGSDGKTLIIHNSASSAVILSHQNGSASAANRLFLPNAADITLDTDSSIELIYDSSDATWVIKSGSGNGSGSGSSSGEKNFITNPDFESNANGYSTFADAAATSPVDGTGGSPNVTFVRSTSSPLRGIASGLLTKDAANRQGEGCSYDLTIDSIDAGKELILSGDYAFSANYLDADIGVWVYDTTNNTLIVPYPISGAGDNNLHQKAGRYLFAFQSTSSITYRLIFFIRSTNATAWTGKFDNLFFGSTVQDFVFGPNIQDWTSFPMNVTGTSINPTKGTVSYDQAEYKRIGDSISIKYDYKQTAAGSSGTGMYLFALPNGWQVDTSKMALDTESGLRAVVGYGSASNSAVPGPTIQDFKVVLYDSTHLALYNKDTSTTVDNPGIGSHIFGFANTILLYSFNTIPIPILNLSSDVVTSNSRVFKVSDFLANGTRVTTDPAALGEYRTRTRTASSATSYNDNAPGTLPSSTDGMKIFNRTYGSTEVANNTEMWDIFVGKNKTVFPQYYSSTGKTGLISTDVQVYGGSNDTATGVAFEYDPTTGVASVFAPTQGTATGAGFVGQTAPGVYASTCYFDVIVSDNPLPVQVDLEPVYIKDYKSSGTDGGTFTSGSYQTRDLNMIENSKTWVSLSSNQFILDAGKYQIKSFIPGFAVDQYKSRLQNITDSSTTLLGSNQLSAAGNTVETHSVICGVFTISKTTTFEVQARCTTTKSSNGFGTATAYGDNELYTQVELVKLL